MNWTHDLQVNCWDSLLPMMMISNLSSKLGKKSLSLVILSREVSILVLFQVEGVVYQWLTGQAQICIQE